MILPVALFGCEAWSLTLKAEKNTSDWEEDTGYNIRTSTKEGTQWGGRLYNQDLHNCTVHQIEKGEMESAFSMQRGMRTAFKI
jgi:hypothetical protein